MKKRIIFFATIIVLILGNFYYFNSKIGNLSDEVAVLRSEIAMLKSKVSELEKNNTVANDDNKNGSINTGNQRITYTTFSSSKADFTFEYPASWTYEETNSQNPDSIGWSFYINPEDKSGPPILAISYPLTESVDFCSNQDVDSNSYQLSILPTDDPITFITYEQCGGDYGSGYIYWQKGKRFANADEIRDIHNIHFMKFYSGMENQKNMKIIQHIAQSIKIK